jgi:predicted AlkP superfamily phosphohydrolase/phosphomutase
VGTVGGNEGIHTFENDTGPDDANHAQDGLYVFAGPGIPAAGRVDGHLLDIAPTLLELMDMAAPESMRGESMLPKLGLPPSRQAAPA